MELHDSKFVELHDSEFVELHDSEFVELHDSEFNLTLHCEEALQNILFILKKYSAS